MNLSLLRTYSLLAAAGLVLSTGCTAKFAKTELPETEDEKIETSENARTGYTDDEIADESEDDEEFDDSQWSQPRSELAARPKTKKRCRGKGKRRKCKMVDTNPGLSAAHGVRETVGDFRWGMPPRAVVKRLTADIEAEYKRRMEATNDADEQDEIRQWRQARIDEVTVNMVTFTSSSNHKWGASLIQFEYEDDAEEEMVWVRDGDAKNFYFFKNGELWKIIVAYGIDTLEGKKYAEVLDGRFKPRFGPSPQEKSATDPKTKAKLLDYHEWHSQEGEVVRAFDLSEVHGAVVVTVIDGNMERRIGVRLPHVGKESSMAGAVDDVLGGSDICYDEQGNMIEDAARCKKLRGY